MPRIEHILRALWKPGHAPRTIELVDAPSLALCIRKLA
jgi:hypothetical protein